MTRNKFSSPTDDALRQLLHSQLPGHVPSPWFTRKVLNRLPQRRYAIAAMIEYALYIAGFITTGYFSVEFVAEKTMPGSVVTVGDLSIFATLVGVTGVLLTMFLTSLISPEETA